MKVKYMEVKRGWWTLTITMNGEEASRKDLTNVDREHIAELIKEGFTSGEIIQEE